MGARNAWEEWMDMKLRTRTMPGLSEQCQKVLLDQGLLGPTLSCKGCVHLRHVIKHDPQNKVVVLSDTHFCTLWGDGHPWQPTNPACRSYAKPQKEPKKIERKGAKP